MKTDEVIVRECRMDGNDIEYRMSEWLADVVTNYLHLTYPRRNWALGVGGFIRASSRSRVADVLKTLSPYVPEAAQVKGKPRPRDTKNDLRGHRANLLYIDSIL